MPGARPPFSFYPPTVVGGKKGIDEEAPKAQGADVDALSTATSSPMAGPGLIKEYK